MTDEGIVCQYCRNISITDPCMYCGGDRGNQNRKPPRETMLNPFFYNGYIVWRSWLDDFETWSRYYFYRGTQLIRCIQFPITFLYRVKGFDDMTFDMMEFVWELFQLAEGENEVFTLEEKQDWRRASIPATFEIRRVEPEKLTKEEATQYWIERYS